MVCSWRTCLLAMDMLRRVIFISVHLSLREALKMRYWLCLYRGRGMRQRNTRWQHDKQSPERGQKATAYGTNISNHDISRWRGVSALFSHRRGSIPWGNALSRLRLCATKRRQLCEPHGRRFSLVRAKKRSGCWSGFEISVAQSENVLQFWNGRILRFIECVLTNLNSFFEIATDLLRIIANWEYRNGN